MKPRSIVLASALGLAATGQLVAAPVISDIYRETFGNSTGANQSVSTVNWQVHTASGAATVVPAGGLPVFSVTSGISNPNNAVDLNAGTNANASSTNGFLFMNRSSTLRSSAVMLWTDEYVVDRSAGEVHSISFRQGNSTAATTSQVAIRIGASAWFVSDQIFSTAAMAATDTFETETFNFSTAGSAWRSLSFASGTSGTQGISVGATTLATALPTGNITAFGIYSAAMGTNNALGTSHSLRIDTFTISAIPEPSSYAALAGLGMLGFAATRRRRRSA